MIKLVGLFMIHLSFKLTDQIHAPHKIRSQVWGRSDPHLLVCSPNLKIPPRIALVGMKVAREGFPRTWTIDTDKKLGSSTTQKR